MSPQEALRLGREILDPLLAARGFHFVPGGTGASSGGEFASVEYVRGDRRLELHFRHSLGLVRYHVGSVSLAHDEYMLALGQSGVVQYAPEFSDL